MDETYRVLIVDDEAIIREGLLSFCWERLGFAAIGSASNGQKALDFMETHPVDLVITDIKMPIMDGLELSCRIQSSYPSCKTIILSGYQDFDYAKTALKSGVTEYLLKPVDLTDLENLVAELRQTLDKERRILTHARKYEKILPLAQNDFLSKLVQKQGHDLLEIEEEANLLELSFPFPNFACIVYRFDFCQVNDYSKHELFKSIHKAVGNYLSSHNLGYFYTNEKEDIICIFNFGDCNDKAAAKMQNTQYAQSLTEIISTLIFGSPVLFQGSVGQSFPSILLLCTSFRQAAYSLDNLFCKKEGSLILSWLEDTGQSSITIPYDVENDLFHAITSGTMEQCNLQLHKFWNSYSSTLSESNTASMKDAALQLLHFLDEKMSVFSKSVAEICGTNSMIEYINDFPTFSSLQNGIQKIIHQYCNHMSVLNNNINSSARHSIHNAVKYIQTNYAQKLTLEIVSREVCLSPCYLSIQFKKETGQNFTEYLKSYRIKKAQEFLITGNYKIYEIGSLIGYQNPKYFTDTFKSFTGLTPLEYRNKTIRTTDSVN